MEESEAIKIIKEKACNNRCIPQLCNDGCMYKYTKCAFSLAIHALEKQTPKKPTYDGDGYAPDGTFVWDEWLCPCCGERYEVDYDYDYCPNCGQRLDWSDEHETD